MKENLPKTRRIVRSDPEWSEAVDKSRKSIIAARSMLSPSKETWVKALWTEFIYAVADLPADRREQCIGQVTQNFREAIEREAGR